jgi:hypothetical protein
MHLFAGAVISEVKEHFTIHCDSSLMANDMYETARRTTQHIASYGLASNIQRVLFIKMATGFVRFALAQARFLWTGIRPGIRGKMCYALNSANILPGFVRCTKMANLVV